MEMTKKYIQTNEVIEIANYPYGFTLKTTLYHSIEFSANKGYRVCTQTINPKNGVLNKPKKSTYSTMLFRYLDEIGHVKTDCFDVNGIEGINRTAEFLFSNFTILTPVEIECITISILASLKVSLFYATRSGSTLEELKPIFEPISKVLSESLKTKENVFDKVVIDNSYKK